MHRSLKEILSDNEILDNGAELDAVNDIESDETSGSPISDSLCVECGDQPAELLCENCAEVFCSVCHRYLHRTGKRQSHSIKQFELKSSHTPAIPAGVHVIESGIDEEAEFVDEESQDDSKLSNDSKSHLLQGIVSHVPYIPMRLTAEERRLLRLLEAALNVSEYTDKVDIFVYSSKTKRMVAQLKEMCSILAGLVVAQDMKAGQRLLEDKDFAENFEWYQNVFEIGRRYKIMNPDRMRDSYGKLMYMVMDSRLPEVREAMDFDLHKPLKTVHSFLSSKNCLHLLDDPLLVDATLEIIPEGKSRLNIQREIKRKELAISTLSKKYATAKRGGFHGEMNASEITQDDVCQAIYSIGDYSSYLRANRHPVENLISLLQDYFDPNDSTDGLSLGISQGSKGARLSHNHRKQYLYVQQSLALWSEIMRDMFKLWSLADDDLLATNKRYLLGDTGQGLNRLKTCPQVSRAMHKIISKVQARTGGWIGSSVVHLGDHNVPNALFFLDKYLQVPRILTPLYLTIKNLDSIERDPFVSQWIVSQYGDLKSLKSHILCDFFKHAFDGSGADNFYDAGSCIDGRLTSAWNWCNNISKKPYYKFFLVTGFSGFNGME